MKEWAVIDRIVDGVTAVLFVGEEQKQFLSPIEDLPKGAKEGSWLLVKIEGGKIIGAKLDEGKTEQMERRIKAKLARLRKRNEDQ